MLIQGYRYPLSFPDPAGNVLKEYDISQKVVQPVQAASQTTLVWTWGQVVAEALECPHKAQADAAQKWAAEKCSKNLRGILKCGLQLFQPACPLPCCLFSLR